MLSPELMQHSLPIVKNWDEISELTQELRMLHFHINFSISVIISVIKDEFYEQEIKKFYEQELRDLLEAKFQLIGCLLPEEALVLEKLNNEFPEESEAQAKSKNEKALEHALKRCTLPKTKTFV